MTCPLHYLLSTFLVLWHYLLPPPFWPYYYLQSSLLIPFKWQHHWNHHPSLPYLNFSSIHHTIRKEDTSRILGSVGQNPLLIWFSPTTEWENRHNKTFLSIQNTQMQCRDTEKSINTSSSVKIYSFIHSLIYSTNIY